MKINASWIDVGPPLKSVWGVPDGCCPMPRFTPNMGGNSDWNWEEGDVVFLNSTDEERGEGGLPGLPSVFRPQEEVAKMDNKDAKYELHKVLSSIQASEDLGVYLCESFRDPRREYMDDYLAEVMDEAVGIDDLHRLLGRAETPLSDKARARFNHLARLLERLSKRVDRVLQQA
jgi:hypothetical protein